MLRLLQIGFIWLGCAVAWVILGSTIVVRTGQTSGTLDREVRLLWGPPIEQKPPRAIYRETRQQREVVTTHDVQGRPVGTEVIKDVEVEVPLPLEASNVKARLGLEHRRKGLVWFATYDVGFTARYTFANDTTRPRRVELRFPLNTEAAVYDGFTVTDAAGATASAAVTRGQAQWITDLAAGERRDFTVAYRARGTGRWSYELAADTGQARDFRLVLDTDFPAVDFPAGTLSPSKHGVTGAGWHGEWSFRSLIAGQSIGVELPQRPSPGPLASRITFFAPLGLLFFFFVVAVLALAQGRSIHPLNYFLFGCAFFAFHLLFAYLVDHVAIGPAFAGAAAVSVALVVSYARLFVGWRFALREMGLAQIIYLVLFSFTFFFPGFTGLAITAGAILTLFVVMQLTGRASWAALAARTPPPAPPFPPAPAPYPAPGFGPPPAYAPGFAPPAPYLGPSTGR
ncbi:MAG TPA: inner membrane CreD family protein [Polyangia bacterium]|jgi:hypothetical protein